MGIDGGSAGPCYGSGGPFVQVPAGVPLLVTWVVSVNKAVATDDKLLELEVRNVASAARNRLAFRQVHRGHFKAVGEPQEISVGFTVPRAEAANVLELTTKWLGGAAGAYKVTLASISIRPLKLDRLPPYYRLYTATDAAIGHQVGQPLGVSSWKGDDRAGFLAYGPYVKGGEPGAPVLGAVTAITFTLEVDNNHEDLDRHMVGLDVWDPDTGTYLANMAVFRRHFSKEGAPMDFIVGFTAPLTPTKLEFRVYYICCGRAITVHSIVGGQLPQSATATPSGTPSRECVCACALRVCVSCLCFAAGNRCVVDPVRVLLQHP